MATNRFAKYDKPVADLGDSEENRFAKYGKPAPIVNSAADDVGGNRSAHSAAECECAAAGTDRQRRRQAKRVDALL